jgi:hypothetical protein
MQFWQEFSNTQSTNNKYPAAAAAAEHMMQWLAMTDPPPKEIEAAVEQEFCDETWIFCKRQPEACTRMAGEDAEMILLHA